MSTELEDKLSAFTQEIAVHDSAIDDIGTGSQALVPQMGSIHERIFAGFPQKTKYRLDYYGLDSVSFFGLCQKALEWYGGWESARGKAVVFFLMSALVTLIGLENAKIITNETKVTDTLPLLFLSGGGGLFLFSVVYSLVIALTARGYSKRGQEVRRGVDQEVHIMINKFWSDPIFQIQEVTAYLRKVHKAFETKRANLQTRFLDTVKKPRDEWDKLLKQYQADEKALSSRTDDEIPRRADYLHAVRVRIKECERFLTEVNPEADGLEIQLIDLQGCLDRIQRKINVYAALKVRYEETDALVARANSYGDYKTTPAEVQERQLARRLQELKAESSELEGEVEGMDNAVDNVTQHLPEPDRFPLPSFPKPLLPAAE